MDAETRYQKALDYLYSFVDFSMTRALRYSPEKFHLERMIMLADSVGIHKNLTRSFILQEQKAKVLRRL